MLGVENEKNVVGYNNYKHVLSKTSQMPTVDVAWDAFKQESDWGVMVDRDEVLKKVAAIRLEFKGAPGSSTDFLIQSIGTYGSCK